MLDRDAQNRLELWDEAREQRASNKVLGMPTGLKCFDESMLGWKAGELIVLFGSTGVGKSWLIMKFAVEAYNVGKKILLISPELTAEEQGFRFDAVYANKKGVDLSNTEVMSGGGDRGNYAQWVEGLTNESRFNCIDSSDTGNALTFNDVWRYTSEYKPDLLLIDGLYLLQGSGKDKAGWETLKDGTAYLKALAQQQRIVCIVAHQPNRSAAGRKEVFTPPSLNQIGYGFGIAENANRVISMSRSQDGDDMRLFSVLKMRGGREIAQYGALRFDVDIGDIEEIDVAQDIEDF